MGRAPTSVTVPLRGGMGGEGGARYNWSSPRISPDRSVVPFVPFSGDRGTSCFRFRQQFVQIRYEVEIVVQLSRRFEVWLILILIEF